MEARDELIRLVEVTGPAIEATDLYRFYHVGDDETQALRGVSIAVDTGEVVAITGPSGSGKSTLLACLAGLDEPDGGMVRISNVPLSRRSELERTQMRARSIGMLFQSNNLIQHLTVTGNVLLAQSLVGSSASESAAQLIESLNLGRCAHSYPPTLSGGESARAGLAVALANGPGVVLADEPTGEVDGDTAREIIALLRSRADQGSAVVIVTHSPAVAAAADRIVRLVDGRVAE